MRLGMITAGVTPKITKNPKSDDHSTRNSNKLSQDQLEMATSDSIFNDSELFDHVHSLT